MTAPACPRCGAPLGDPTLCEQCAWTASPAAAELGRATRCPVHHVALEQGPGPAGSRAWCPVAGRYSVAAPCPFACPHCRGPLDWQGGCDRCHGAPMGQRAEWTFPGDRYDRTDDLGHPLGDGWHWYVTSRGPRPASPPPDWRQLEATLARLGAPPQRHDPGRNPAALPRSGGEPL